MRNIWRIFRSDWQRISASVVAVVVIMGLNHFMEEKLEETEML